MESVRRVTLSNRSKDEAPLNHDIQLEQKLLHYRSEIKKFQRIIHLQKKKLNSQEEEIEAFKQQSLFNQPMYQQKQPPIQKNSEAMAGIYSFFSYSTFLPVKPSAGSEEPCFINGNFTIRNDSGVPLRDPLICLRFSKPNLANLSGKMNQNKRNYASEHIVADETDQAWSFLPDHSLKKVRETGEFWLRPTVKQLDHQKELVFQQFEILLPYNGSSFSVSINGYIYGLEIPNGRQALNTIICNVT